MVASDNFSLTVKTSFAMAAIAFIYQGGAVQVCYRTVVAVARFRVKKDTGYYLDRQSSPYRRCHSLRTRLRTGTNTPTITSPQSSWIRGGSCTVTITERQKAEPESRRESV